MIFFFDEKGTLIRGLPETIKQGSNKSSRVWLFMPISPTNFVNAYFTLPNGEVLKPIIMTRTNEVPNVKYDKKVFSCWFCDLKRNVTRYAGTLKMSFEVYAEIGENEDIEDETITTDSIELPVSKGVFKPLNIEKTYTYEELMSWLGSNVITREDFTKEIEQIKNEIDDELEKIDLSDYQPKTDERLNTTSKEIVGAINEVNSKVGHFESVIVDIQDFVDNQKVNEFIDLTRRFLDKKIIIVCKYNGAYFVPIIGIDSDNGTYIWRLEIVDDDGYVTKLSLTAQSPFTQLELKEIRTLIVEANPTEEANGGNLEKLKVGDSTYSIPTGGGISQEELDKKVDEWEGNIGGSWTVRARLTSGSGTQTGYINMSNSPSTGNAVAMYNSEKQLSTNDPTTNNNCVNLKYFNENKGTQLYKHAFTVYEQVEEYNDETGDNTYTRTGRFLQVECFSTRNTPYNDAYSAITDVTSAGWGSMAKMKWFEQEDNEYVSESYFSFRIGNLDPGRINVIIYKMEKFNFETTDFVESTGDLDNFGVGEESNTKSLILYATPEEYAPIAL